MTGAARIATLAGKVVEQEVIQGGKQLTKGAIAGKSAHVVTKRTREHRRSGSDGYLNIIISNEDKVKPQSLTSQLSFGSNENKASLPIPKLKIPRFPKENQPNPLNTKRHATASDLARKAMMANKAHSSPPETTHVKRIAELEQQLIESERSRSEQEEANIHAASLAKSVNDSGNSSLRKSIRKSLDAMDKPLIGSGSLLRTQSTSLLDINGSPGSFRGKTTFNLVKERLIKAQNLIANSSIKNAWTKELEEKLRLLIGSGKNAPQVSFEEAYCNLLAFLSAYDTVMTIGGSKTTEAKTRELLSKAVGGEGEDKADEVIKYLRNCQHDLALKCKLPQYIEKGLKKEKVIVETAFKDLSKLTCLFEKEADQFTTTAHNSIRQKMAVLDTHILSNSTINYQAKGYYQKKIRNTLPSRFKKGKLALGELLALSQSNEWKKTLEEIKSKDSAILYLFRHRLQEAHFHLSRHARREKKISEGMLEQLTLIKALVQLDEDSLRTWMSNYDPTFKVTIDNGNHLDDFIKLLTTCLKSKPQHLPLLSLILTGKDQNVSEAATSIKALQTMLEQWNNLEPGCFNEPFRRLIGGQEPSLYKPTQIYDKLISANIPFSTVPRTLFGVEESDLNTYQKKLGKEGPQEMTPASINVNRETIEAKNYKGTLKEVLTSFYKRIFDQFSLGGYPIEDAPSKIDEIVETWSCDDPKLLELVKLSSTSWKQIGRKMIDEHFPDLHSRSSKETRIAYTVFDAKQVIGSQTLICPIYPGTRADWSKIDVNKPIAQITFEFAGQLTDCSALEKMGYLQMTELRFAMDATVEERIAVYKALHMEAEAAELTRKFASPLSFPTRLRKSDSDLPRNSHHHAKRSERLSSSGGTVTPGTLKKSFLTNSLSRASGRKLSKSNSV